MSVDVGNRVRLILPDGSVKEVPRGARVLEVAEEIGPGLARAAVAAKLEGKIVGLNHKLEHGGHLQILTFDDGEGRAVYRHSTAHVMAEAVQELFPDVKLGIGPATEDGFYYDFDTEEPFSPEDLERIEERMSEIIEADVPFERIAVEREEALRFFDEADEPYKVELVEDLEHGVEVTYYRQGDFIDLCAGPHLPSTGRIGHFKLLSVAGAYWRGDERRQMLQRIYGTAYPNKADLDEHLHRIEEAKRRDHRRLGRDLDLFSVQDDGGPGLVYWHPKGALIREIIEDFWRKEHRRRGYDIVMSPHIAKLDLWKVSGHWDWYQESMYAPMTVDDVDYLLKPMNCPFHILIYKTQTRSYRDLPLRWGELGTVYRYERSGVLHGMLRVRGFTQDDAHIFCRPDQLEDEIIGVVDFAQFMMEAFGFDDYELYLSVRDPGNKDKFIGGDDVWERAEGALQNGLERMGLNYHVDVGEAKFYGPAIDIKYKDAIGREWQGPTIQCDLNLPERFDLNYVGQDGHAHRPVMIHRTVLGSMERFVGSLIEHYAGAFPVWLAPEQIRIVPITDHHHEYAEELKKGFSEAGLRVHVDDRNEKVGYKIRQAELEKIPYMLVVGDRELESDTVSVRTREDGDIGEQAVGEFIDRVVGEVEARIVKR